MTAKKWQITTIIMLVAVFVAMIVLMVLQSVNNSRLLDYLLDMRVKDVTYSRYNDTSLMFMTYGGLEEETQDDGIMLMADGEIDFSSSSSNVLSVSNSYSTDGCLNFSLTSGYYIPTDNNYCDIKFYAGSALVHTSYFGEDEFSISVDLNSLLQSNVIKSGVTYTVNYVAYLYSDAGGEQNYSGTICTFIIYQTQELPTPPTKTGYTFTGWYTDEACTNLYTEDKVTGDISLYAGFRAHTYTVKFNANNSDGAMTDLPMTYDQAVTLPANTFTKEHFVFVGWATSANGSVTYTNGQSVKNLTSADNGIVTLFAIFERSEWVVTYDIDGEKTTATVAVNAAITLPDEPSKEGYTFMGWAMSNGTVYTNQPVTSDMTLTAKFEIIRCKITFYVDGEKYGTYECDYGTNVSNLLLVTGINPVLYRLAPTSLDGIETITADNTADLELTAIGEIVPEKDFPWVAALVAFGVMFVLSVSVVVIVKAVKRNG